MKSCVLRIEPLSFSIYVDKSSFTCVLSSSSKNIIFFSTWSYVCSLNLSTSSFISVSVINITSIDSISTILTSDIINKSVYIVYNISVIVLNILYFSSSVFSLRNKCKISVFISSYQILFSIRSNISLSSILISNNSSFLAFDCPISSSIKSIRNHRSSSLVFIKTI
jgi:hypothetical protein